MLISPYATSLETADHTWGHSDVVIPHTWQLPRGSAWNFRGLLWIVLEPPDLSSNISGTSEKVLFCGPRI